MIVLRLPDPVVVITVLIAAVHVDAGHRRVIRLDQIRLLAGQADPAERAVPVVKQLRSHDVLHIGRKDETVLVVHAVLRNLLHAGIIHGFEEGVAVVKEIGAAVHQRLDQRIMPAERKIHQLTVFLRILGKHRRAFLERQPLRTVAAFIRRVAGCLVGTEINVNLMIHCVLKQVDDVAVIGDGTGLFLLHILPCRGEAALKIVRPLGNPALIQPCLDP